MERFIKIGEDEWRSVRPQLYTYLQNFVKNEGLLYFRRSIVRVHSPLATISEVLECIFFRSSWIKYVCTYSLS